MLCAASLKINNWQLGPKNLANSGGPLISHKCVCAPACVCVFVHGHPLAKRAAAVPIADTSDK